MSYSLRHNRGWLVALLVVFGVSASMAGQPFQPASFFQAINQSPHLQLIAESQLRVVDHEIGLDALKKVRGVWGFRASERASGDLSRYTWQVLDGFTSQEVLADTERALEEVPGAEQVFACDGRACGAAAQWASRVFGQRLLYGRADLQRYRVIKIPAVKPQNPAGEKSSAYTVVLYGAAPQRMHRLHTTRCRMIGLRFF